MPDWTESEASERPGSWAFQLALCLLGPLFFLSYLFSLLAPLPLLYLHSGTPNVNRGRLWSFIALILGLVLAASIKGWAGALGFFLFAALPAVVLGELLVRRQGPEKAVLGAVVATLLAALAIFGLARLQGIDLLALTKERIDLQLQTVSQNLLSKETDLPDQTRDDLKSLAENPSLLYAELPGMAASALLLLCILPCLALIRWNPKGFLRRTGIGRDFLRKWRTPDWLVWIALFSGTFQVFQVHILTEIAGNALKPLLLIYFFQGMSILAYFLDSLRLRGPIRVFLYGMGIVFLTPMVVSFGFFDLWFNFRGRHKPPAEEKEP